MKLAFLALLPLALLTAPRAGDDLRAIHREGRVITFEEHEWLAFEVDEISMRVNGSEMEGEAVEQMAASMPDEREEERVVTTTWIDGVEDGRPVRVRRRFDEVHKTKLEGDEETESEGVLVGRTLLLEGSADDDDVEAELAEDGPAVDEVYLANHRLTPDSDLYLPDEPVDVGDTWTLDDATVRKLLGIDRDSPVLFEKDAEEEDDDFLSALEDAVEASGTVEYVDKEDVDGLSCAVLAVTLEMEADDEIDPADIGMEREEGMETTVRMTLSMKAEERLWFAIDAGHAVRSEGEVEGEMAMSIVMTAAEIGLEIEIDVTANMSGGYTSGTSVE